MMAGFSILDMLAGNTQPGGFMGQTLGNTTPTGLAGLMNQYQAMQSPGATALGGAQPPTELPTGPAKKPGFFGKGGTGWGVLGILGDAISAGSGGQPMFTQMVQRQREQEAEQQQAIQRAAQERAAKREEWDYQQQNDIPSAIREFQQFQQMPPEKQAEYLRMRQAGAPRLVTNPATGEQGYIDQPAPQAAPPPIGGTYTDPDTNITYQRIGPGTGRENWKPIGGAGPSGPQTFR